MRLTYVAGASPDKWLRVWNERHPRDRMLAERVNEREQWTALRAGDTDLAIVRVPNDEAIAQARELGFAIELYRERSVLVLPREHAWSDEVELSLADIAELERTAPQASVEDTLAVTAAGVGVCVLPMSVARLYHRRDLVAVPLSDGPEWPVLLAWNIDSELAQDFVGITRGRGAHSSRGQS